MWTLSPIRLAAVGLWAVSSLAGAGTAHANLVQNGSFSAATFDDWTVTGDVQAGYGYAVFNAGDQPPNAVLDQVIGTVAGQTYALTFDFGWGSYNGQGQSIIASVFDGATLLATATESPPYVDAYDSGGAQPYEIDFTASSSATTIQFNDDPANNTISSDSLLTGIDVEAPEPASITLLGFAAGAVLLRRSRRRARLA